MNFAKIIRYRAAILLGLVTLSAWQVYVGFDSILDLVISGVGGKFGWIWMVSGPITFFFAASLGAIFAYIGLKVKAGLVKKFWGLLLLTIIVGLSVGCLIFAWADWFGTHFGFTLGEYLRHFLFIILPAVACTALFWTIQQDIWKAATEAIITTKSCINDPQQFPYRRAASTLGRWLGVLVAAGGSIAVVTASGLLLLLWGCEPPSVAKLTRRFPSERKDLETIIAMSDQDSQMAVIDPTWLQLQGQGFSSTDKAIGISTERWDEYRKVFRRNGIMQGIRRDSAGGDTFIIVQSIGLLDNGYSNGYLYCVPGSAHRYEPCSSTEQRGEHPYSGGGDAGYEFIKLTDRWYAYREGPG